MTLDTPRSPRSVRLKILTGTMSALVGGALGVAALVTPAVGDEAVWVDHEGNATTCEQETGGKPALDENNIPIGGEDITNLVTYEGGEANDYVTITSFPAGWTLTGVVVKGGDGYRVYFDLMDQMTAPDNNGGQAPTISHWFVCAEKNATTPPPTTTPPDDDTPPPDDDTPPPDDDTPPPDDDESPEPSESPSTEAPETPKPSESTTPPPGGELPDTGANTGLLGLGAVLLLGGAALAGRSAFLTR